MSNYKLINGNSLQVLKTFEENSIDSIVCDPPYELGFMGKSWDSTGIAFNKELWAECLRVLKPGGHLISFSGSRTYHRMAVAIEDAGFEIRDQIMWVYGSGFPKSLNVSNAIDKLDAKEEKQWQGWGTALKPAHEPIVLARKPLSEKTVAENVLRWGTGAINIDESRIDYNGEKPNLGGRAKHTRGDGYGFKAQEENAVANEKGRWPANFIHDGLDTEWSRYFYCPKASKKDRNEGLEGFPVKGKVFNGQNSQATIGGYKVGSVEDKFTTSPSSNNHPTVKPTDLMSYLVRLITPPNGTVLDPFNGSGSTGKAAIREKFNYIGIDLSQEYLDISKARIEYEISKKK